MWTEQTPAEDTPESESPHDVVGLRTHDGTMWMSNDRVPLKKFESPYGGGMSSLPGAAGDLPTVMFPVAPVLLAGGPQSSSWQVAVVRVDETPAGDSSEREYPCVTQSQHRPIDIYELPDCLPHTVVEGGPAGPEVIEPLVLLVRDHADPAGQHAVMRNTIVEGGPAGPEVIEPLELLVLYHADPVGQHAVIRDPTRLLEHPLARPESSLGDRLVERISDGEPAARQVPDTTLDSRPMEGITYLEHLAPGVSLDSGPMEGMSCLEPLEQLILHSLWIVQPKECVIKEGSVWEPMLNPVISYTLDSQLMEGNTYLEHSALGVSLDSGPTEGASCLEPLEQSAPSSSLAVRPVEGVTVKVSERSR